MAPPAPPRKAQRTATKTARTPSNTYPIYDVPGVRRKQPSNVYEAAERGDHKMILRLLRKADAYTDEEVQEHLNSEDRFGQSPLMWACDGGHEDAVRKLVELGADVLHRSVATGRTAIHAACHMNRLEILYFLVYRIDEEFGHQAVVDAINAQDKGGLTPLVMATNHGEAGEALFLYLLELGAQWNEYNPLSNEAHLEEPISALDLAGLLPDHDAIHSPMPVTPVC